MKKITTLKLEVHSPRNGRDFIYQDCEISRCLRRTLGKGTFGAQELQELSDIFDIEYRGKRSEILDELGAVYKG